jgi:hypothetical protein
MAHNPASSSDFILMVFYLKYTLGTLLVNKKLIICSPSMMESSLRFPVKSELKIGERMRGGWITAIQTLDFRP